MKVIVTAVERNEGAEFSQVESEFVELEKICAQGRSCLEIGSLYGGSAKRLAEAMPEGSRMVCLDLGFEPLKKGWRTLPALLYRLETIQGRDVTLILGNSSTEIAREEAAKLGPYDLVFIDAGHDYVQVQADWEFYGKLGKIVAFHDIVSCQGSQALWNDIKGGYKHVEIIHGKAAGIGILWRG